MHNLDRRNNQKKKKRNEQKFIVVSVRFILLLKKKFTDYGFQMSEHSQVQSWRHLKDQKP